MSTEGMSLSLIQEKLLEGAADRKSFEEISRDINGVLSPARVAVRIKEILNSRTDQYTEAEERALNLYDLQRLKTKLWEMLDGFDGTKVATPLVKILEVIQTRLDTKLPEVDDQMKILTHARAQLFVEALNISVQRAILEYAKQNPDFDEMAFRSFIETEIPFAFNYLNDRTIGALES